MQIKVGYTYNVNKNSVVFPKKKTVTVEKIKKINGNTYYWLKDVNFILCKGYGMWGIDSVIDSLSLKNERKEKLQKINKKSCWRFWK